MRGTNLLLAGLLGLTSALAQASCNAGGASKPTYTPGQPAAANTTTPIGLPFAPVSPSVYVPKVKNLLLGLPATDAEIAQVAGDPTALAGLIDQWMAEPEYQAKMIAFFRNAFQQAQSSSADRVEPNPAARVDNGEVSSLLLENIQDSFALTVWQLVTQGQPLNKALTTQTFMMTPPLMAFYAYLDDLHVDDNGARIDRVVQATPSFSFDAEASAGAIPITQTLDPTSASYMHWYNPAVGGATLATGCQEDPRVYTRSSADLMSLLFGTLAQMSSTCGTVSSPAQFQDAEYAQWRMVSVRTPNPGEATTAFYDLPAFRDPGTTEMVLHIPRVGFFTTPAFFASWPTNSSNQARVTMNQTIIVALGRAFDDTNSITPVSETSLDGEHAAPGTPCYGCHETLDPMRQFFRQAYTLYYHDQLDPTENTVQGVFADDGVTAQGNGITDLGAMLAAHHDFPTAWAQKLCNYANSAACAVDDPEFLRIAAAFQASNYQFSVLVREILASPLTTGAVNTKTFDENGTIVPIARRDHLCVLLSNRLGLTDACGLGNPYSLTTTQRAAFDIAGDLPADGYSRGASAPILANDPTLFFRSGVENLCGNIAAEVVDAPTNSRYTSANPTGAITDFIHTLMALGTNDPHAAEAEAVLQGHFASAQAAGASATDALRSTFVLACLSPSVVGLGPVRKARAGKEEAMTITRRQALMTTLFGAGAVGLRALATGLPAAFLANPRQALADGTTACFAQDKAQYVILNTLSTGDPLNGNVPGTYDDPNIVHPPDPTMAPAKMTIGGQQYTAATPWTQLPASVLARTCFFHHTTLTNAHPNQPKVMSLMGAVQQQEMLVSLLSAQLRAVPRHHPAAAGHDRRERAQRGAQLSGPKPPHLERARAARPLDHARGPAREPPENPRRRPRSPERPVQAGRDTRAEGLPRSLLDVADAGAPDLPVPPVEPERPQGQQRHLADHRGRRR